MARGLSELQQWMLRTALENRRRCGSLPLRVNEEYADLFATEVKEKYFGLTRHPDYHSPWPWRSLRAIGNFKTGNPAYNRASVITSRAMGRLKQRGLAIEGIRALSDEYALLIRSRPLSAAEQATLKTVSPDIRLHHGNRFAGIYLTALGIEAAEKLTVKVS
jgi:hypothetical protein